MCTDAIGFTPEQAAGAGFTIDGVWYATAMAILLALWAAECTGFYALAITHLVAALALSVAWEVVVDAVVVARPLALPTLTLTRSIIADALPVACL
jgi:hypothetical protein